MNDVPDRRKAVENILLVNPKFPPIHQSYDYILPMMGAKFIAPPLSLLTVAALIPSGYNLRLVDMNIRPLSSDDIQWADAVFVTGIGAQSQSMLKVAARCQESPKKPILVAGGLHVSVFEENFLPYVDAIVLCEAEDVLGRLLDDIRKGELQKRYTGSPGHIDMHASPCPRFDLVNPSDYLIWTLQYSRGCPYNCEFCELPRFYGHKSRAKGAGQFIAELDAVYNLGFRGVIMLGDDNFHHSPDVNDLLAAVAAWQHAKGYPFMFFTQTDIRIANECDLMDRMVEAGFTSLQIGIESPSLSSLQSMGKTHNTGLDLVEAVKTIHAHGLEVQPAMLLGSDGDPDNIADLQFDFLQAAGTPRCMISLLRVYKGNALHAKFSAEGRVLKDEPSGNQTGDFELNYRSRMGNEKLLSEAVRLIRRLYEPRNYFERCWRCLGAIRRKGFQKHPVSSRSLHCFWNYVRFSRAPEYNRRFFLLLLKTLLFRPRKFTMCAGLGILGYHYYMMSRRAEVGRHESPEGECA